MSESESVSVCSGVMGLNLNDTLWDKAVGRRGSNIYLIFSEF